MTVERYLASSVSGLAVIRTGGLPTTFLTVGLHLKAVGRCLESKVVIANVTPVKILLVFD